MKHVLRFAQVNRPFFDAIVNGSKTVETRAATVKYQNIKPGDILVIVCMPDKIEKTVVSVKQFKSIEEMFAAVDLKTVNPFAVDIAEARAVYYSFPGYKQKIEQYGLIAFGLTTA